ncbi:MAG: ParB/RepB/Spo0J family partition protein, partial [Desulfovibrionaceae bacterium]|nr:ParB/RepB/Spo0J family partition protein [Desulfovibrionaceae bacterium]
MAALERGLGRGLDSLLRSTREAEIPSRDAKKLALTQLTPGPHQPRKRFDDATLADLATSIKNQGVVQPLIVRPKADSSPQIYEIVAGERRWRAAKLAGLTEIPVVICSYTDAEAMTVALVENLQRENLSPLEEAEALQTLRDTHKLNQEDLAAKLGKSRSAVANALRLLQLPQHCKEALAESRISAGHARTLLSVGDEEIRDRLLEGIIQRDLSVRDAESIADYWKRTGRLPAPLNGEESGAAAADRETRRRAPKPQRLKDIQIVLRKTVHHGASISGNEEKGRIALPYTSPEELEFLLKLLGMSEEYQGGFESGECAPEGGAAGAEPEASMPADDGAGFGAGEPVPESEAGAFEADGAMAAEDATRAELEAFMPVN